MRILTVIVYGAGTLLGGFYLWCGCGKKREQPLPPPHSPPPAYGAMAGEPEPGYVVALVNGTPLVWEEMEKRAKGFMQDDIKSNHLIVPSNRMDKALDHFRRRSINAFIYKTVMLDEAARQGLKLFDTDRNEGLQLLSSQLKTRNWTTNDFFKNGPMDEATMRREFEDGLIIDKLLKLNVRNKLGISDSEMSEAIATLQATNKLKRTLIAELRQKAVDGADFAELARKHSECPSAREGGNLGLVSKGKLGKAFDQAAFSLKPGEVSKVTTSTLGLHVIKRTPEASTPEDAPQAGEGVRISHILLRPVPINRRSISTALLKSKYSSGVKAYYEELKAKAKVENFWLSDGA